MADTSQSFSTASSISHILAIIPDIDQCPSLARAFIAAENGPVLRFNTDGTPAAYEFLYGPPINHPNGTDLTHGTTEALPASIKQQIQNARDAYEQRVGGTHSAEEREMRFNYIVVRYFPVASNTKAMWHDWRVRADWTGTPATEIAWIGFQSSTNVRVGVEERDQAGVITMGIRKSFEIHDGNTVLPRGMGLGIARLGDEGGARIVDRLNVEFRPIHELTNSGPTGDDITSPEGDDYVIHVELRTHPQTCVEADGMIDGGSGQVMKKVGKNGGKAANGVRNAVATAAPHGV